MPRALDPLETSMTPEAVVPWPKPLFELLGFLALFLAAGAIGFRYFARRGLLASGVSEGGEEVRFVGDATRRAAMWGLAGTAVGAAQFAINLPGVAEERHLAPLALITGDPLIGLRLAFYALALVGFLAAAGRRSWGWPLAAVGVVASPLRAALFGQWPRVVNPAHELAGGLWIGTLFLLVACALVPLRRTKLVPERRGVLAAGMVRAFSPFALFSAGALFVFGVITAWLHLKRLDALWTTPYGYALIAKLCVVAVVVGLGAWNWRRQLPRLGSEAGALELEWTARVELIVAFVVLMVTAILVSLPSPR
jgi:hypothetical protein